MKINEVILSEGWYDDAKSKVSQGIDKIKQSPVGQKVGYHAGELGKVGSDIGNIASGIGDYAKSALYKATGFGGDPANVAATRIKFLNDFQQELNLAKRSARNAGQPYDNGTFAQQYIKRYGWTLDQEQLDQINDVKDDPKKLANIMYNVALGQKKGKGQYASTFQKSLPQDDNKQNTTKSTNQPNLTQSTQQITDKITKMTGTSNLDDLTNIAKVAMQTLYSQNQGAYTKLYREIIAGNGKQDDQGKDELGRKEPTFESKTRNFSNRHK